MVIRLEKPKLWAGGFYFDSPVAVSFCDANSPLELASWHHRGPSHFLSTVFEAKSNESLSQNFPGKHLLPQGQSQGSRYRRLVGLEGVLSPLLVSFLEWTGFPRTPCLYMKGLGGLS